MELASIKLGDVYLFGYTESNDLYTTEGVYDESYNGNEDIFVTKLFGGFSSEPKEVYSVSTYKDDNYLIPDSSFNRLDEVFVELRGLDSNNSMKDFARINISFRFSVLGQFSITLRETANDTGIYRGSFIVPLPSR